MKARVIFYIFIALCVSCAVPAWDYIFGGFKNFGYNMSNLLEANVKMIGFNIFFTEKFKKFNGLKKFSIFMAAEALGSVIPKKWDVTLSAGAIPNLIIFALGIIVTEVYYYRYIKGKFDKDGQAIIQNQRKANDETKR